MDVPQTLSSGRRLATNDYFALLRDHALLAGEQGNYAISAALVIRTGGIEVVTVGANTVFGSSDPSGHAEMNAIRLAHELGAQGPTPGSPSERGVIVRRAPHTEREAILYTTLEPCPMCTVCIITAGIEQVVIAAEDPPSGSLSPERLHSLPPLWYELAHALGLRVTFCQSTDPTEMGSYLSPALHKELIEIFLMSRERLDRTLGTDGVLDLDKIGKHAAMLFGQEF